MIARVFPRRTRMTPTDSLAFIGSPPATLPEVSAVHVSVTFTWDMALAERIARQWRDRVACEVEIGGPGAGMRGGDFDPGMYLKPGMVITSRGCDRACKHCSVPLREGKLRELTIRNGYNVLDDNLLACSPDHILSVFTMLRMQPERAEFTGGLEANRLRSWHIDELDRTRVERMYFAYDGPEDKEPLFAAGRMFRETRFGRTHHLNAYVLIGTADDTYDAAERRLRETWAAGFMPFAMLYRDDRGLHMPGWERFQRVWNRPAIARKLLA